jgi:hypothetical protein
MPDKKTRLYKYSVNMILTEYQEAVWLKSVRSEKSLSEGISSMVGGNSEAKGGA